MKDIIIVGRLGAGKTAIAEYLHRKTEYPLYEVGDIVREEFSKSECSMTPLEYAVEKFREFGRDYFVKKLLFKMNNSLSNIIVGIRSVEELNCVKAFTENSLLIGIEADKEIRRRRYEISHRAKINNSDFDERERVEESWGVKAVIESSDIIFQNNGGMEELKALLNKYLKLCEERE